MLRSFISKGGIRPVASSCRTLQSLPPYFNPADPDPVSVLEKR